MNHYAAVVQLSLGRPIRFCCLIEKINLNYKARIRQWGKGKGCSVVLLHSFTRSEASVLHYATSRGDVVGGTITVGEELHSKLR